jgi:radical S-adenosyl methionine domain-containing protein 2
MDTNMTLVINWHITEACNYRCDYCYAKWKDAPSPRELIHDATQTEALIGELYRFFASGNSTNPLWSQIHWKKLRLNLAGGEPLLHHRKLPRVIRHAREVGFEVSLITNASRLTANMMAELVPHLSWLGISLDSAYAETNKNIGRIEGRGKMLELEMLAMALHTARAKHPQLKLKLNTVVNRLNVAEDFSLIIARFAPDKWKVLRMLPVVTDALAISDDAFTAFVARHQHFAALLCAEDNHEMRESYLMVDPYGRFFQNGGQKDEGGYSYSQPILVDGAASAFGSVQFAPDRFRARYPQPVDGA